MAATVYRYRWRGCDLQEIKSNIDPSITSNITNAMAKAWMDVTLDPGDPGTPAQTDLDEIMLKMGWVPFSVNPTTPLRAVTEKQEINSELTVDADTISSVFVNLLTVNITTDTGFLDIMSSVSGESVGGAYFRLLLDGIAIANGGMSIGAVGSATIQKRVAITPGAHTVILQWMAPAGSAAIKPVTNVDYQSANLFVKEVVS